MVSASRGVYPAAAAPSTRPTSSAACVVPLDHRAEHRAAPWHPGRRCRSRGTGSPRHCPRRSSGSPSRSGFCQRLLEVAHAGASLASTSRSTISAEPQPLGDGDLGLHAGRPGRAAGPGRPRRTSAAASCRSPGWMPSARSSPTATSTNASALATTSASSSVCPIADVRVTRAPPRPPPRRCPARGSPRPPQARRGVPEDADADPGTADEQRRAAPAPRLPGEPGASRRGRRGPPASAGAPVDVVTRASSIAGTRSPSPASSTARAVDAASGRGVEHALQQCRGCCLVHHSARRPLSRRAARRRRWRSPSSAARRPGRPEPQRPRGQPTGIGPRRPRRGSLSTGQARAEAPRPPRAPRVGRPVWPPPSTASPAGQRRDRRGEHLAGVAGRDPGAHVAGVDREPDPALPGAVAHRLTRRQRATRAPPPAPSSTPSARLPPPCATSALPPPRPSMAGSAAPSTSRAASPACCAGVVDRGHGRHLVVGRRTGRARPRPCPGPPGRAWLSARSRSAPPSRPSGARNAKRSTSPTRSAAAVTSASSAASCARRARSISFSASRSRWTIAAAPGPAARRRAPSAARSAGATSVCSRARNW